MIRDYRDLRPWRVEEDSGRYSRCREDAQGFNKTTGKEAPGPLSPRIPDPFLPTKWEKGQKYKILFSNLTVINEGAVHSP